MRGQAGYSVVEIVIGMAVLAVLSLGWMTFDVTIQRELQRSLKTSKAQKVFLIIQSDILRADRFMASREPIPELEVTGLSPEAWTQVMASSFLNKEFVTERCYMDGGAPTEKPEDCRYKVAFYKVRQRDLGYEKGSSLSSIPLSRVNMRVTYTELDPRTNLPVEKIRYFSRLTAQVATY